MTTLRGAALLEQLRSVPALERDRWVDALLGFDEPPVDEPLPRGAVPYLPCGVDEIIAMVTEVPLGADDVLVDLGSGLGRVAILAHLISGARTCGVEIQEQLVARAREHCRQLALPRVSFTRADAAELEIDGSVFFLYAPFNGTMLAAVLRRVEAVARRRPIVVCAVGLELDVPWLRARPAVHVSLALYDGGTA